MMKCMYCQGEMVHGSAPFHIDRKDVHISLDKVLAWVCTVSWYVRAPHGSTRRYASLS